MNAVGMTNIGLVRQKNEDNFLVDSDHGLFVVCDGMGGHKGGEVASGLAIQAIKDNVSFKTVDEAIESLTDAIKKANEVIRSQGQQNTELNDMGTTMTAAAIIENQLIVANVGDSSLFLIQGNKCCKITIDHTLAEKMVNDGLLKPEDVKKSAYNHILTRALGVDQNIEIDLFNRELCQGDIILLCTDGLTDLLEQSDIEQIILNQDDLHRTAQELIELAITRGGHDNITTILVSV